MESCLSNIYVSVYLTVEVKIKMTPAINTTKKAKIDYAVHEYDHDPSGESYGLEVANKSEKS